MRAAAAATISLAPVAGFFWSSVLGVSSVDGTMMVMAYFLRVRTAMPSAETAMRATAAATTSLAPVEGFF